MRCSSCESAGALGGPPQTACSDCALTERTAELVAALNRATWPWCLAHNLAMAGALCESFWLGQCREEPFPDNDGSWFPGCGRNSADGEIGEGSLSWAVPT